VIEDCNKGITNPKGVLSGVARHSMYNTALEPISKAYFINVSLLSFIGNGSVKTFPRQRIHATIEELLDDLFLSGPCLIEGESVGLCTPLNLLGKKIGNNVLAAKMNFWRRRFLCCLCHIK
jgi:hypothetical protein